MFDNEIKLTFWNYLDAKYITDEVVDKWHELGINLPMSFPVRENMSEEDKNKVLHLLDRCQGYGMKVLLYDERIDFHVIEKCGRDKYVERVQETIKDFASHPAIYGFTAGDEPNFDNQDDYTFALKTLKELLPSMHHFGNLVPYFSDVLEQKMLGRSEEYLLNNLRKIVDDGKCDILAYDHYTQYWDKPKDREEGIRSFLIDLDHFMIISKEKDIPLYFSPLCIGHFVYHEPSEDDIRWQMYIPLVCGAKGLVWFYFHHTLDDLGFKNFTAPFFGETLETTPTFDMIKREHYYFNHYYKAKFDRLDIDEYYQTGKIYLPNKGFKENKLVERLDAWLNDELTLISLGHYRDNKQNVVIVTNGSQTQINNYTIFFKDGTNNSFWLTPGEIKIFEL